MFQIVQALTRCQLPAGALKINRRENCPQRFNRAKRRVQYQRQTISTGVTGEFEGQARTVEAPIAHHAEISRTPH
jgi:hypothetical protein